MAVAMTTWLKGWISPIWLYGIVLRTGMTPYSMDVSTIWRRLASKAAGPAPPSISFVPIRIIASAGWTWLYSHASGVMPGQVSATWAGFNTSVLDQPHTAASDLLLNELPDLTAVWE